MRPALDGDDGFFEAERREHAGGVDPPREPGRRRLEFGGEPTGVDGVEPVAGSVNHTLRVGSRPGGRRLRDRRQRVGGVGKREHVAVADDERAVTAGGGRVLGGARIGGVCVGGAFAGGDAAGSAVAGGVDSDVDGDHVAAAVGERAGGSETVADADLEQPAVSGEFGHERMTRGGHHGGGFMIAGVKNNFMLVDIVPVGDVSPRVKREASAVLRSVYDCDVTVHDDQAIPENAYDDGRGQYRAEDLIEVVGRVGSGEKNIGITPRDLYYRRRNYVFGLAYLNGSGSVISTHRLRTSSDGGVSTKPAIDVFADRVRKEAVHEVGHTLGLEHCDNNKCVMSFSPTVREVDVKEENLCGSCSRLVR